MSQFEIFQVELMLEWLHYLLSFIATPGRPLRVFQNIFFKRISQKSLLFEPKIKIKIN